MNILDVTSMKHSYGNFSILDILVFVNDYVMQFSELVDQLMSYESEANPLYYAMHFVDGLKQGIRGMVMI
jgi:hypothetical protein